MSLPVESAVRTKTRKGLHAAGNEYVEKERGAWDVLRGKLVATATGGERTSASDLTEHETRALRDLLNAAREDGWSEDELLGSARGLFQNGAALSPALAVKPERIGGKRVAELLDAMNRSCIRLYGVGAAMRDLFPDREHLPYSAGVVEVQHLTPEEADRLMEYLGDQRWCYEMAKTGFVGEYRDGLRQTPPEGVHALKVETFEALQREFHESDHDEIIQALKAASN